MKPTIPPQSIDAEMSVLGAIFVDNDCIGKVKTLMHGDDFYLETHRVLFDAFCRLREMKSPIDFITTVAALKSAGTLEAVGGAAYLMELTDFVPTAANMAHYCAIVRDKSHRRRMIKNVQRMLANAAACLYPDFTAATWDAWPQLNA